MSNKTLLIKLSNYPEVFELLIKCDQEEIEKISKMLDWSTTLVSNIQKYNSNIFNLLEKTQIDDRKHIKKIINWSTVFISQMLKSDRSIIDVLNKIDVDDRSNLKDMLEWSTTLSALLSKDHSILEFLIKLSEKDKFDLSDIIEWSPSTVSLVKNNLTFFKFLSGLVNDEIVLFKQLLAWHNSTFRRLFEDNKAPSPDYKTQILSLYHMWDIVVDQEQFFKSYLSVCDASKKINYNMLDAFSKGQINSKAWLVSELSKLDIDLGNMWTLCGWVGSLAYIVNNAKTKLKFNHIRSFDIDGKCAGLADQLNKAALLDNWRFKASTLDVNSMYYVDYKFATQKSDGTVQYIQESADTVINTSCDHMDKNTWWERIPSGTLVVLQNNNFLEKTEHVNTVASLAEFKNRYPMHNILYEGELDCDLYVRYMLIGRK